MKKFFLSLVVAMMATTTGFAQSSLIATLIHDNEVTLYHGSSALKQALEVANHGDIIALSSGRYDAANITKAVTLRGAGMEEDTITGASRTEIVGDFQISIESSTTENLAIEGIYHNSSISVKGVLTNAVLQKCHFYYISSSNDNDDTITALTCFHCNIAGQIRLPKNSSASFIGSVVAIPSNLYGGNMEFTNCIILKRVDLMKNSYLQNSILYGYDGSQFSDTNMASLCAGLVSGGESWTSTNKSLTQEQVKALFKPDTFYELTEEAKNEYVGSDDTEIGIYGGNLPWSTRILSPQITKCNVAAKTTADGKLSVDIEVKAAE